VDAQLKSIEFPDHMSINWTVLILNFYIFIDNFVKLRTETMKLTPAEITDLHIEILIL
jgi:hypothetical protein